jgi:hypothetical protein
LAKFLPFARLFDFDGVQVLARLDLSDHEEDEGFDPHKLLVTAFPEVTGGPAEITVDGITSPTDGKWESIAQLFSDPDKAHWLENIVRAGFDDLMSLANKLEEPEPEDVEDE